MLQASIDMLGQLSGLSVSWVCTFRINLVNLESSGINLVELILNRTVFSCIVLV